MKICHLTSVHIPFDTRIFYRECKSLIKAGYEVYLIAGHPQDDIIEGINLYPVPARKSKIKRILLSPWDVYRRALTVKAAIYHFHDPELLPIGFLLKLHGKKVIYDVHEDYPVYLPSKQFIPKLFRYPIAWLTGFLEIFSARFFDAIIVATPSIYERFKRVNKTTIMVRNFPSCKEFAPPDDDIPWDSRIDAVAYIGLISVERGIREIVRSLGLANHKRPVRLILGGKFETEKLEQEIRSMPEFPLVDYKGFMSREGMSHIFSCIKAGLVIFHPQPHHYDAYPNKFFEYMSAGIPIIASDFPNWRSIIEEAQCGLLVDPTSPQALAKAIDHILSHSEEAEAMGMRGRKLIEEKYIWEQEEEKLVNLYHDLLHER